MYEPLTVVHLAATGFMTGLIWTVHVVHYPLFALVNEPYRPFQEAHMRRISALLALPWGAEALSALIVVLRAPAGSSRILAVLGAVLVAAIVAVTAFGAAPAHGRLVERFDEREHRRLLRIDGVRVVLWSARLVVAVWLVLLAR